MPSSSAVPPSVTLTVAECRPLGIQLVFSTVPAVLLALTVMALIRTLG